MLVGGGEEGRKGAKGGKAVRWGGVGGLSSWVLSGSHHVPPRRPTSSCGPGAQGRKLDTGLSTAGTLWERFLCVCDCVHLRGEALAHRTLTGPPPLNSPLPHPLCPLARHVLTQHPPQTHAQDVCTHRHEHTHGFNQTGMRGPP